MHYLSECAKLLNNPSQWWPHLAAFLKNPSQWWPRLHTFLISQEFRSWALLSFAFSLGRFKLSVSWVFLAVAVLSWRQGRQHRKSAGFARFRGSSAVREEALLKALVRENAFLWIHAPHNENAAWLNNIVSQFWPFCADHIETFLQTTLQAKIREAVSGIGFQDFVFAKIRINDEAPRVKSIHVASVRRSPDAGVAPDRQELALDLDIFYGGDLDIGARIGFTDIGINNIKFRGLLRCVFGPLVSTPPFFGAVTVAFVNSPNIDFDFVADGIDYDSIKTVLKKVVTDAVDPLVVLPNRLTFKLKENIDVTPLKFPPPEGLLCVHLIEARDLQTNDDFLGCIPFFTRTDPYVVLRVGAQTDRSEVLWNNQRPDWRDAFEFFVDLKEKQSLELLVNDKDLSSSDDLIGSFDVEILDVVKCGVMEDWFGFGGDNNGEVNLKLMWYEMQDGARLEGDQHFQDQGNESQSDPDPCGKEHPVPQALLLITINIASIRPESVTMRLTQSGRSPVVAKEIGFDADGAAGARFVVQNRQVEKVVLAFLDSGKVLTEHEFDLKDFAHEKKGTLTRVTHIYKSIKSPAEVSLSLRNLTRGKPQAF